MSRRRSVAMLPFTLVVLAVLALAPAGHAGFTDAIKKKISDKTTKKAEDTVDKAASDAEKAATGKKGGTAAGGTAAGGAAAGGAAAGDSAKAGGSAGSSKVSAVSTKFDYVPGDKVLLLDDFTQDELGEFPARWSLVGGNFEVAEMEGERWLRCTSPDGHVRPKLPAMEALPEFWTLEFDFFGTEPISSALTVRALNKSEQPTWEATFPHNNGMFFRSGEIYSTTPLEDAVVGGRHHVMVMARGTAVKVYMDRQRMANVPDISAEAGMPSILEIRLWAATKPMITNVRFAEGCRPPKDMLAEGKLVTYGIRFETGSDVVMPESAPVLRQVAAYMEANPTVKLKITGHTDNVGQAASNLDLSKRRAASVAKVLADQFAIAADRFETDGKGDTQTVATNAKPEGRAMNRRVEFAKL